MADPVLHGPTGRASLLSQYRKPSGGSAQEAAAASWVPSDATTVEATALPTQHMNPSVEPAQLLWQLYLPAQNTAGLEIAEQSLAAALCSAPRRGFWQRKSTGASSPVALELEGKREQVQFALRGNPTLVQRVFAQLVAGYRQVERSPVDLAAHPEEDPLRLSPGEGAAYAVLHLAEPAVLPLHTPERRAYAEGTDPLQGIVHALANTPAPLRVVSQLVVDHAPVRWGERAAARLRALAMPRRRPAAGARPQGGLSDLELGLLVLLPPAALIGWLAWQGLLVLLWLLVPLLLGLGGAGLYAFVRHQQQQARFQLAFEAATEKVQQRARVLRTCLRLYVIGPAGSGHECQVWLTHLVQLYSGAFAGANRLVAGRQGQIRPQVQGGASPDQAQYAAMRQLALAFRPVSRWARLSLWLGGDRARPILTPVEVATLFHLPHTTDADSYLQLQTSQQRLAPPGMFTISPALLPAGPLERLASPRAWSPEARAQLRGFFAGFSRAAGETYPIRFPASVLEGHLALVGMTGSGKSTFLQQLAHWAFAEEDLCCIVLDPHNDLATQLRGLVTRSDIEQGRVVVLDPTDPEPVGFPSLWDADPAVADDPIRRQEIINNVVATMERLSDGAWGARVRTNFHTGLETLMEASATDRAMGRPVEAHTLLDIYPLFTRPAYRDKILARLEPRKGKHTELRGMWTYQHGVNTPAQELQEIGSVLNRIAPLLLGAGGYLLGQRAPRFSWRTAMRKHQICLVSLGGLGADARRSVGSLLLSYLQSVLLELRAEPWHARPRVLLIVDELQAFDPNALVGLFGEVRKFGGQVIASTNSLKRIEQESPALASELDANVGTWIVGRVGAADGEALLWRLQGTTRGSLTLADLLRLPRRHFFASALVDGQPQPLFRFETPPYALASQRVAADALDTSRSTYGRHREQLEPEIHAVALALETIRLLDDRQQRRQAKARAAGKRTKEDTGAPAAETPPPTPDPAAAASEAEAVTRQVARTDPGPARQKPPPEAAGESDPSQRRRSHPRKTREALFPEKAPPA